MIKRILLCLGLLHAAAGQDGCKAPAFLSAAGGSIETPYYAYPTMGGYPNNLRCRWVIRNPANNNISISFAESFWLEPTSGCSYDRIVFFNGERTGAVTCMQALGDTEAQFNTGPLCGAVAPAPFVIGKRPGDTTSVFTVEVCTDGSQTGQGFHMNFNATNDAATAPLLGTTTLPPVTGPTSPPIPLQAHFHLTLDEQLNRTVYITSPGHPGNYPNYANYSWTISTESNSYIQVTAEAFSLEYNSQCGYDSLTIVDPKKSDEVVGVFCGNDGPIEIKSSGNELRLYFKTDGSGTYAGFRLRVELTKCKAGESSCPNDPSGTTCFSPDMLCDGKGDCPNNEDENCPLTCGNPAVQPWLSTRFAEGMVQSRIVGGIEARPHSYPWHVAVFPDHSNARGVLCGGTIIDHHFVLTSAQCCVNYANNPATGLHIGVGEHNILASREPHAINYTIQQAFLHPRYAQGPSTNQPLNNPSYDYCLLKTKLPIFFNDHVAPVCLGMMEYPENTRCYLSGWGAVSRSPGSYPNVPLVSEEWSPTLRQVDLRVVSAARCRSLFAQQAVPDFSDQMHNMTNVIGQENMCAGTPGKGGCFGDVGGALVCQSPSDPQTWQAVGIFSSRYGCGDTLPSIFSKVSSAVEWISSVMFS
ncbi:ovochymase-2-like [Paramacrobiotus metropolitanus]|uniref:ovochymase-2-like n=1 Tax=Paramacrobiotus metropolitanus TaxID=2943436 RepID=UPI002445706D|nr:ovochymase-2-like [Paramacrobiotus metropolitanus]